MLTFLEVASDECKIKKQTNATIIDRCTNMVIKPQLNIVQNLLPIDREHNSVLY